MNDILNFVLNNIVNKFKGNVVCTRNHSFDIVFSFRVSGYDYFRITAKSETDSIIFCIDCKAEHGSFTHLQPENCVNFAIGGGVEPEVIRSFYHQYTCCLEPAVCHSFKELGNRTHTALLKYGDTHYNILGLQGDIFCCAFDGQG